MGGKRGQAMGPAEATLQSAGGSLPLESCWRLLERGGLAQLWLVSVSDRQWQFPERMQSGGVHEFSNILWAIWET